MQVKSMPILFLMFFLSLSGQLSAKQNGQLNDDREFVNQYNKRFEKQKPLVGDSMLEGITAFDERGKPFSFERFKGKHTVIVFGCLT